jgi:hypothetical protein
MQFHRIFLVKSIRFPALMLVIALVVTGCSGSSDSGSIGIHVNGEAVENTVAGSRHNQRQDKRATTIAAHTAPKGVWVSIPKQNYPVVN